MDINVTRRELLQKKYRELAALGMIGGLPRPVEAIAGRVQHFATEEDKQAHLAFVAEGVANGLIPF